MTATAQPATVPLSFARLTPEDSVRAAAAFADRMWTRRSVRDFSPQPLPEGVVEAAIRAAASAPSGANIARLADRTPGRARTRASTWL